MTGKWLQGTTKVAAGHDQSGCRARPKWLQGSRSRASLRSTRTTKVAAGHDQSGYQSPHPTKICSKEEAEQIFVFDMTDFRQKI